MIQNKSLSIIIVTFESEAVIESSLRKINFDKYEVFVVDNASKDNTIKIIEEKFPKVHLIKLSQNSGYGRANNVALKQISTDYALIINPDALIFEEDIEKVLNVMDKNDKIALAGAMPYSFVLKNNQISDAQLIPHAMANIRKEFEDFYHAKFITGACMILRMSIFKKIGFFDENFFLYCEDNEICKRTIKNGYYNALIKDAKFYHQNGTSSKRVDQKILNKIYWHRNGWSKAYYTEAVHGVIVGKLKAIRTIIKFSFLILLDFIKTKKVNKLNKYGLLGTLSYFIGLKAFKKNGEAR